MQRDEVDPSSPGSPSSAISSLVVGQVPLAEACEFCPAESGCGGGIAGSGL